MLLDDKGCDAGAKRAEIDAGGVEVAIQAGRNRSIRFLRVREKDRWLSLVESMSTKRKNVRRVTLRYGKTGEPSLSFGASNSINLSMRIDTDA